MTSASSDARDAFDALATAATKRLVAEEVLLLNWSGERSDFVRFNQSKVRQAGQVSDRTLSVELVRGRRHASASVTLAGDPAQDEPRVRATIERLREALDEVPDDPLLLYATETRTSERRGGEAPPPKDEVVRAVEFIGRERDLVGVYAGGTLERGFASSLGSRNWHETESFHLDWSFYLARDKAVTTSYAGLVWEPEELRARAERAAAQLAALAREPKRITPGRYRVYLAPSALDELFAILGWGGFGLRAHRSKTTPLLRMVDEGLKLNAGVSLTENIAGGLAPDFPEEGFERPPFVDLVRAGAYADCLVSPRSAIEYGVPTNGAAGFESPLSLDVAPGSLETARILGELGTGLYVSNLHYLNFSDRSACRTTGMTRFATFWVEKGEIVAPIDVMRFDETLYRMLGENLIGLTRERELLFDSGTYGGRSTRTRRLPGALIDDFTFTL